MNVAGLGEANTASGFNAFLYEPINTRLMVMAVRLPE